MRRRASSIVLSSALLLAPLAFADQPNEHEHRGELRKLGAVHFPVSCNEEVRAAFEHGVALLHSFAYESAKNAFNEIAAHDPQCAMAQWGVAMSQFHPIWAPPTDAEFNSGREAAAKAAALKATPREQGYIAAINAFYGSAGPTHVDRVKAFEQAMAKVAVDNPKDDEAQIYHALAILGVAYASPPDKTYALQKQAAVILNRELVTHPDHPGIAHYIIHSFDYPELAELALPAARAYAKIAPDAPHALHMPSHIFTRLGMWDDSIASNRASAAAANALAARAHPGATPFDALHAMDYLTYAYLQTAQDHKARALVDEVGRATAFDNDTFAAAYALAAIPARFALERQAWQDAAALQVGPAVFPWKNYPWAEAITWFARGVGAARSGDTANAKAAVERLTALRDTLSRSPKGSYDWATQVDIQRRAVTAWLLHAEGKNDEALALLRSAADLEGSTDKSPVTPGQILPAREQLGDLLLEVKQPAAALEVYEASLKTAPRRFRSLAGAARAATLAGSSAKAISLKTQLADLGTNADSDRPELTQAREALAK